LELGAVRFLSEGPNIPDRLLTARDDGQVVFLCGAGVSMPCQLPSFKTLTEDVLRSLKVPTDADAQQAFSFWRTTLPGQREVPDEAKPSFDLIFNMLQQSYGRDEVGKIVAERLAVPTSMIGPSRWHRTVARLSADQTGAPQIVTTNFDLLFEVPGVMGVVKTHVPPTFPDLRHDQPISGITYLHGRLNTSLEGSHNYVLSSADFGRAYLADGWATNFMRMLLERYTVVLLGYTANDPPMKYLLQGLNSADALEPDKLFAFDRGQPDKVEAKWRDRGVTPIAYGGGSDHAALWDSLDAWAVRAEDPAAWRASVIDMARNGPRALAAYKRGQVAHVARYNLGAKEFADAKPAPPAEWLCVFDGSYRTGDAFEGPGEAEQSFDPLATYGLDDDAPRANGEERTAGGGTENLLTWRYGDSVETDQIRLGGRTVRGYEAIPPRLYHLSRWICGQIADPVVAWWAARQSGLHPRLAEMLTNQIDYAQDIPKRCRDVWALILNAQASGNISPGDMWWYRTRRKIARQGWTPQTMRDFASCTAPVVELELPYGIRRVEPPSGLWSELSQTDFFRATVKFRTDRGEKIEVIDDALPSVFAILNNNLIRAVDLLNEIGNRRFEVPSLYRDVEEKAEDHVYRSDRFILWFLDMLERMADLYPAQVFATATLWPQPEGIVFDRLRMFVWNKPKLFMASQAADLLLQLEQSAFWHPKNRRELLFLIRDRWGSFSLSERLAIEERLLAGPDKYDFQSDAEYPVERAISVSMKLTWLVQAGCALSEDGSAALAHQKSIIPDWDDGLARSAASATSRGKAGYVVTNSDPEVLLAVADADIVATLLALPSRPFGDFTEDRPFKGLVANHPARAMNALELAAQRGEYPPELWRTLIHDWPDTAPEDATRLFHDRLRQLPAEVLQSLHHTIGDWIRDKLPAVAQQDESYALSLLDDLLNRLLIAGLAVTESSIGDTFKAGQRVPRSRRTYAHAINALVGKTTEALAAILNARKLPKDAGLPQEFSTRFERLLASAGEGSDHAVACLAIRLPWLTYIAPDWAKARLLPLCAVDHPAAEPAWNGLLHSHHIPRPELFVEVKTQLLTIFPKVYSWNWDSSDLERAHDWVVQTCIWHQNDDRYTSYDEAIACIRTFSTAGRVNVIHFLGQVGRNGDGARQNAVVPFIKNAWPREAQYQIESTSAAFVSLLEDCGDDFPAVLEAVSPFLRQIHRGHHWLYRFYKEIGQEAETPICAKFPRETLALMDAIIPDDPADVPIDLGSVLDQMVEAWPEATRDRRFSRLRELAAAR
jgi:hypothetical protein